MPNFQVRIFKGWETRDSLRRWVNNYEFSSSVSGVPAHLDFISALVVMERPMHLTPVQFLSATISTWEEDSEPYNPSSFVTVSLTGTGSRVLPEGVHALDTNVCWFVQRNVQTGRQGRVFYRGCLHEADVEQGSDGYFKFTAGSAMGPGGAVITAANAAFAFYFDGQGQQRPALIGSYSGGPPVVRNITGLAAAGIVINRRNHRYFDRALG